MLEIRVMGEKMQNVQFSSHVYLLLPIVVKNEELGVWMTVVEC